MSTVHGLRQPFLLLAFLSSLAVPVSAQPLVYVTTSDARLRVINPATGNVFASLDLGPVTHESREALAISPDRATAYVTAGQDLVIVDTATMTIAARLTLGGLPGTLALSADGSRVYVGHGTAVSVVNTKTRAIDGASIPIGFTPADLELAPDGSRLYVLRAGGDAVDLVDLATRTVTTTIATHPGAKSMAVLPDGTRLFVAHSTEDATSPSADSVTAYDTATLAEISTLVLPDFRLFVTLPPAASRVGRLVMHPSGTRLYVPRVASTFNMATRSYSQNETIDVIDAAALTHLSSVTRSRYYPWGYSPGLGVAILPDGSQLFIASWVGVAAIDPATLAVTAAGVGLDSVEEVAAAQAPDCWFEASPERSYLRAEGGAVSVMIPSPSGCGWAIETSAPWIVPPSATGTSPSQISFGVLPAGQPQSATFEISSWLPSQTPTPSKSPQKLVIEQLIPHVVIDMPGNGATLPLPFTFTGWAIERDADPTGSSKGVGSLELIDQSGSGFGPVVFDWAAQSRPDVAALYGDRYRFSGLTRRIGRMAAGTHILALSARSEKDGTLHRASVAVTVQRTPLVVIDRPGPGAVAQPFTLHGWAADMTVPFGTGVDLVQVHAHPLVGGDPILVGTATLGVSRPDLIEYFNDPGAGSAGFQILISTLPPGRYRLVASPRYSATGAVEATASVELTVDNPPPPPGPPIGVVDTPVDGAAVAGAIGITGWALDDANLMKVSIFREPVAGESGMVLVGDATFVEGARPDVAALFPSHPQKTRAGWGLLVLTNMLPNGGNGMFTFHIEAYDNQGNVTLLGRRTILADNAGSLLPFGAIDTPVPGGTVSGTLVVFGWALTPAPAIVPPDGATIDVLIDGVVVGQPSFDQCRGTNTSAPPVGTCDDDIARLFGSGYRNIAEGHGAIGAFLFDTTTLSNGMHTIEWRVVDSLGRTQGIGSRYFHVDNP